jgi:hypothetical protein
MMMDATDSELMERYANGDAEAFEALFARYERRAFGEALFARYERRAFG